MFGIETRPAAILVVDGEPWSDEQVLERIMYADTWISDFVPAADFLDLFYRLLYTLVANGAVPRYEDEALATAYTETARVTTRILMEHGPAGWIWQTMAMGAGLMVAAFENGAMAVLSGAGDGAMRVVADILSEVEDYDGVFGGCMVVFTMLLLSMTAMLAVKHLQDEEGLLLEVIAPFID